MNAPEQSLDRTPLWMLTLATVLVVAPHFRQIDVSISLAFLLILLLRSITLYRGILQLNRWLLGGVTLVGAGLILSRYPLLMGLPAKVALLSLMMGLKLMECRRRRDLYVVVFLGYFTLITHFLFEQGMGLVFYVLMMVLMLTAVLMINSRAQVRRTSAIPALRYSAVLLLQSLPIMLVLFFLFPRLDGPLWNMGTDNSTGRSGLSDNITMGSISQLVQSREVAFRVEFEDQVPRPNQRYWRGPVLWHTDGRRWDRVRLLPTSTVSYQSNAQPISYRVTLEPSPNRWLYTLDLPQTLPPDSLLLEDFQLLGKRPPNRRYRYTAASRLEYHTGPLSPRQRRLGLQLPDTITPRMQSLVSDWRSAAREDREVVQKALNYFRNQPFYYTLNPPLLSENPVDEFLFDTRRGFCEHFATSFTTLMRLANIPARIVTGYQGGEINPLGDYMIVRQSDAHAWSEIWLPESGWTRVDPTAAVAPERIERPFDLDLQDDLEPGMPISFSIAQRDFVQRLFRQLNLGIDALNAGWHRWVLGYSRDQQNRLMQMLGIGSPSDLMLAGGMVLVTASLIPLLVLLLKIRGRPKLDPLQRDYLKFCRKLARRGIQRLPYEGPHDFAQRIYTERPDLQDKVAPIIRLYIGLRYGGVEDREQRRLFHQQVGRFRV